MSKPYLGKFILRRAQDGSDTDYQAYEIANTAQALANTTWCGGAPTPISKRTYGVSLVPDSKREVDIPGRTYVMWVYEVVNP